MSIAFDPAVVTADALAGELPDNVFHEAVVQADVAISITDPRATILYVNPTFERVTGYRQDEVIGKNQSLLSAKTTPRAVYAQLWETILAKRPWSGRLINRRRDGSEYLADLLITPVLDATGEIRFYLGIHRDVTEMYRLECRVRNQRNQLESVLDAAPVAIALLDGDDCVVLDNHEYKKLIGDLGLAEPASILLAAIRANLGHGVPSAQAGAFAFVDEEVRIDLPGNRPPRWFSCTGTWVRCFDEATDGFFRHNEAWYLLLVAKEITALKAQQERARIAALQAMMAEEHRVAALREVLGAAVYQLEGLLSMIESVAQMQARRASDSPSTTALMEVLHRGEAVLNTLRRASPEPLPAAATAVNLNEVIRDVLDLCTQRMLAVGISVAWQPQAILPAVNGSALQLRTLFKVLIDNAIEAMNVKGWDRRELSITTRHHRDVVEATITDSGPGIPTEQRWQVFEPFYSTKPKRLGTGLSMAQQIVADHGGEISIDPQYRDGCRIRIALPLPNEEVAR